MSKLTDAVKGNNANINMVVISVAALAAVTVVSYRLNKMDKTLDAHSTLLQELTNLAGAQVGLSTVHTNSIRDLQMSKNQ